MMKIEGKKIAEEIIAKLKQKPVPKKFLAAFLVGEDPASVSFINQKKKVAEKLRVDFRIYRLAKSISNDELREKVGKIVRGKTCGGALVQLPLPEQLNRHYILNVIPREKDVDVLGERALGAFYTGRNPVNPPAVGTVERILRITNYELRDKNVAVVGSGLLVGKPIAVWLKGKTAGLGVFDEHTRELGKKLKEFDLIITGTGEGGLIKPEMLKEGAGPVRSRASAKGGSPEDRGAATSNGAGVIDFGYAEGPNGELMGDFDTSQLTNLQTSKLVFYTPTPGGTGPILVAQLFENFYTLNSQSSPKFSS